MTITINGKPVDVADDATLYDIISLQNLPDRGVAVAVDNRMVQRADWHATTLHPDAGILIIKAACGG